MIDSFSVPRAHYNFVLRPHGKHRWLHEEEGLEDIYKEWPHSQVLPRFLSLAVRKCSRGPGIIYHVSDVETRGSLLLFLLNVSVDRDFGNSYPSLTVVYVLF